ncbi:hypothetical protein [Pyrococcus yayanosii]|uniref:Uncharacterized protein n=1 Tax=Pyrococcus yayanosii (strain CH1 / JCM 16557) TaxID=529709 RepID=F8AEN8_PYRYC|nr:hypothetical protein [Pyrococcus yayanosii]AEH24719.1 hypothetical protein PYCH_10380 [Pyrococcus yayanosii CH1]
MKEKAIIFGLTVLVVLLAGGIYYTFNHYSFNYEWKTNLEDYRTYRLIGNSTLNGYVKANGEISVYILTKEDFKRLKEGESFSYYRAWEHVKDVEFKNVRIPDGDYLLVIKNDKKGMQWISVKLVNKK